MPDTLDETGFDPESMSVGEDALLERIRDYGVRAASVVTGDTQVTRQRGVVLLMIAAVAVAFAPAKIRVPGLVALILQALDMGRRR